MKILFPGTSYPELARKIIRRFKKIKLGKCEIKRFACQEIYVRIKEDVRGKECVILQTTTANVNEELMEVFLLADALKRGGAKDISLIMPHFGYARQDRVVDMGESISSKVVADLLVKSGIGEIITFDLHSDQIEGFFSVPVYNIKCYSLFADYFKRKKIKDIVVAAPDAGAAKIARRFSDLLNSPLVILHKVRIKHHKSMHTHLVGDVSNKTVVLFDDMIDTAGTICSGVDELVKNKAKDVYIVATHGIFSKDAFFKLKKARCREIVVANTIPHRKDSLDNLRVLDITYMLKDIL